MKINKVIPSLVKVSDKLSTTKDFEVVSCLDSIIKKMAEVTKTKLEIDINKEDLHFANDVDTPLIREAAATTLIQVADVLDKVNTKLADRVDAAIKLLAKMNCDCIKKECSPCEKARNGVFGQKHCKNCVL